MIVNCDQIINESERLRSYFIKCHSLKASDMREIIDLIESVSICSGASLEFKTINGQSILGTGNIQIDTTADGTETKIIPGTDISISGTGSSSNPYIINNVAEKADGSETKINAGQNVIIAGTGRNSDPYVINVNLPLFEQVNSDWAATSGKALILNKPVIPAAQVPSDWNATSGVSQILNKPNLTSTDLNYIASDSQGEITSSNGASAIIPIVNEINAGLMSPALLNSLNSSSDNIKTEIIIDIPTTYTNQAFADVINNLDNFEVKDNEILTFKSIRVVDENLSYIYYIEMLNIGKGQYGVGGHQFEPFELKVTSFVLTSNDLESDETTQIIDLGTTALNVVDKINSSSPNLVIQDQSEGYVLIKGTFNVVYREYLWVGPGGIYGSELGADTAVITDLTEITQSNEVPLATSTLSGTVKTDLTVADPIVYLKASIDALLANKENLANKQNSLDIDGTGTKYPTVDAVNTIGLQKAYNVSPLITTTTPLGAITLRRGSAADTDNILVGQNGAGTNTTSITGNGLITSSGYLTGGTVDVTTSGSIGGNYNIYDDFNRVDSELGVLGTSTSGHVWEHIIDFTSSPVNRTKIQGGMWVNSPGEIGYLPFHTPTPVKSLGAVFSWVSAGGATSNTVMNFSISATGYKSIERLFHVNISIGQLSIGLYTNTPTSEEILLTVPLSLAYNTEYKLEYSINGINAVITLNGTNYFISNPKIAEFTNARNGFFEFFSNNADAIDTGRFHKIWTSCESQPTMGNNYNNALSATTLSTTSTTGDNIFKGSFSAGNNASFLVDKFASANTLNINSSSNIGIRTAAATHSLTLGSTATGISAYNTTDQTTNTEYFNQSWSGANNIYLMGTRYSGTGSPRALRIGVSNTVGFAIDRYIEVGGSFGIFNFRSPNTGFTPFVNFEHSMASSSSLQNVLQLSPAVLQSGTAGYRCLYIAPFESSVGSGVKNLIDAGTKTAANSAGTYTSKFSVDSAGLTTTVGLNISGQTASTVAILDASKNIVSASTATYPNLTELSYLKGVTSAVQTQINAKADINSQTFTGTPTAPTATVGTTGNQIATLDYVLANSVSDTNALHKSGDETFTGVKSSVNTGATKINGISLTNNGTGSNSNSLSISNTSTGYGQTITNTAASSGIGLIINNLSTTTAFGAYILNTGNGTGIRVDTVTGNAYRGETTGVGNVFVAAGNGTGLNFLGQNGVTTTFSVNKAGDIVSNSISAVSGTFSGNVTSAAPTLSNHLVTKSYADGLVVGLLDDRGSYNASTNVFPSTGGSGTAGAILKGDIWYVSVAGNLGGRAVLVGDSFRAITDSPGQTVSNWSFLSSNIGYVPANDANVIHTTLNETKNGQLNVVTTGSTNALLGTSVSGIGVNGTSSSLNGVNGESTSGIGVRGASSTASGVFGTSSSGPGITATSSTSFGLVVNNALSNTADLARFQVNSSAPVAIINYQGNISAGSYTGTFINTNQYISFSTSTAPSSSNSLIFRSGNHIALTSATGAGISALFNTLSLTSNRTFTFPNANGTFALTSDIPSSIITGSGTVNYIPKFNSGGVLSNSEIVNSAGTIELRANRTYIGDQSISNSNNLYIDVNSTSNIATIQGTKQSVGVQNIALQTAGGNVLIGTFTDDVTNKLQINGNVKSSQYRLSGLNTTPSSSSDTGTLGEIRFDANYIYFCVSANTWKRSALTTW